MVLNLSRCAFFQIPKSSGEMRPSGDTAAASVIIKAAPPTARLPRCTRCHSLANPSAEEYSHIGETTIRFLNVTDFIVSGVNSLAINKLYSGKCFVNYTQSNELLQQYQRFLLFSQFNL